MGGGGGGGGERKDEKGIGMEGRGKGEERRKGCG